MPSQFERRFVEHNDELSQASITTIATAITIITSDNNTTRRAARRRNRTMQPIRRLLSRLATMIRSLLSVFGIARETPPDPFRNRNIFSFWDGTTVRHVDPLPILRRMDEAASKEEYNLRIDAEALDRGDIATVEQYAPIINKIFDVQPLDVDIDGKPSGLTAYESLELLRSFVTWQESLKKNTSDPPITP